MSITSDGIFTIKAGQGLTQAIAAEIGISEKQLEQLNRNKSVWSAVLALVEEQQNNTNDVYSGGNNLNGKFNENYIVKNGQTVKIVLTGVWNKILDLVNHTLGTNFEMAKTEAINDKQNETNATALNSSDNTDVITFIEDKNGEFSKLCKEMLTRQHEISKRAEETGIFPWPKELSDEYNKCGETIKNEFVRLAGQPRYENQKVQIGEHIGTARYIGSSKETQKLQWLIS